MFDISQFKDENQFQSVLINIMAIYEMFQWSVKPAYLTQHEAIIEKYAFILKLLKSKIGNLISFKYFNFMYGPDNSPLGGRVLILEYSDLASYDEFQERLIQREDFQGFQSAWGQLINADSLRASLMSDRSRELWFKGSETEINSS